MKQSTVRGMILDAVGRHWLWLLEPAIYLGDVDMGITTPEAVIEAMKDYVPPSPYIPEIFDCENQADSMLGHLTDKLIRGAGVAWNIEEHAFVVFITKSGLWMYDNGEVMPYADAKIFDCYKLRGRLFKQRDFVKIG